MKRVIFALVALVIASANAFAGGGQEQAAPETTQLAGSKSVAVAGVLVEWKIEGEMLRITLSARTTGWIAIGFDPSRAMRDADIVIGFVSEGNLFIRDDYGIGIFAHGADTDNDGRDDIVDATGSEIDGVTTISFAVPLDSGDALDKPKSPGSTHKIIVARGPDGSDDFGIQHEARGSAEITL